MRRRKKTRVKSSKIRLLCVEGKIVSYRDTDVFHRGEFDMNAEGRIIHSVSDEFVYDLTRDEVLAVFSQIPRHHQFDLIFLQERHGRFIVNSVFIDYAWQFVDTIILGREMEVALK